MQKLRATLNNIFSPGWSRTLPWSIILNLLMVYLCYSICRFTFLIENLDIFESELKGESIASICKGGLIFDSSAIFYTNALYLLMVLLPLHYKENAIYQNVTKWIFVGVNTLANIVNLVDCIYYAFSQKRTTVLMLDEFGNNTNIGSVVSVELINHWYLVVLVTLMTIMLIFCYRPTDYRRESETKLRYYVSHIVWLLIFIPITICAMRGSGFKTSSRPIALSNAHQYVKNPTQTAIVVNTPFSMIRTFTKHQVKIPEFFGTETEISEYYKPIHTPSDTAKIDKKNVVILIVESFAEEFIGARNKDLDNGTYKGYTTFIDSLINHCTTFEHTYANGWISIDAIPAVLSSIPKMYNSYILTPYAFDDSPGIAKELKNWGYTSAFFHGAENSSMGFQAATKSAGFDMYFGRTEYNADPRFDGDKDYDGTWAIWDEEFLQYMCAVLDEMPQPFLASVFTASSHHPFAIPERYKDKYPEEGIYPIHKCIRYTDNALRQFFNTAKKQPWFDNTIFIITADHASSRVTHELYKTAVGDYRVPILFYDPSGRLEPGTRPGIAQQIDIMPTVLSYLGYDKEYVAFGKNLLTTPAADTWAFNWHNIPQYLKGDYLLQYNDYTISGLYNIKKDPMLKHDLVGTNDYDKAYVAEMECELKALLQEADMRMKNDELRIK